MELCQSIDEIFIDQMHYKLIDLSLNHSAYYQNVGSQNVCNATSTSMNIAYVYAELDHLYISYTLYRTYRRARLEFINI